MSSMNFFWKKTASGSQRYESLGPLPSRIGWFGSLALVVNNISGPGLLDFPAAFQQSGWLPASVAILVIASLSAFVATTLVDAMNAIEGGGERLEFSSIFGKIFGPKAFAATQALYLLNLFSQNVAAIVSTAQATDALSATLFGSSLAWDFERGRFLSWSAAAAENPSAENAESNAVLSFNASPFEDSSSSRLLLSFGYVFCFLTLFPLGCMDLEDNMFAQKASFVILIASCLYFVLVEWNGIGIGATSDDANVMNVVPAFGARYRDLTGVCLFNFAFCVTVPAWRNEKAPSVNATALIWLSCLTSAVGYAVVGYFGARAYTHAADNVLDDLTSPTASAGGRVAGGIFAWAIIGLGVPVFSVLMKYNLRSSPAVPPKVATFVAAVLPWLVSWLLYQGHGILALLSWSGLVLDSAVDFLLPMAAALAVTYGALPVVAAAVNEKIENADSRPLPPALMPYYVPVKVAALFLVTTLVLVGLGLQVRHVLHHHHHHLLRTTTTHLQDPEPPVLAAAEEAVSL